MPSAIHQLDPWRDPGKGRYVIMLSGEQWDPDGALRLLDKLDELEIPFEVEVEAYYE